MLTWTVDPHSGAIDDDAHGFGTADEQPGTGTRAQAYGLRRGSVAVLPAPVIVDGYTAACAPGAPGRPLSTTPAGLPASSRAPRHLSGLRGRARTRRADRGCAAPHRPGRQARFAAC